MSDDEDETHCPLCVEEMDLSDQNFLPCPCGYRVCMWCWHHIRENLNGLCPACRTPYNADPHAFSAVDRQEIIKKNRERKQKEKHEKNVVAKTTTTSTTGKTTGTAIVDRRHLHNFRVVQRNLVYVIGVPIAYANEDLLRKPEYFGQYGKIGKVVIHRNPSAAHTTVSTYVTFVYKEDAKASIQSLDAFHLDGHPLRASFGTTKYCNNFIRGVSCNNPDCVYLHDLGDDDDRFTKEEIQAGHSKIPPVPGKDQIIVTGNGGPSGTGKRPVGEPVLPPPVFIQDTNSFAAVNSSTSATSQQSATTGSIASGGSTVGSTITKPAPISRSSTTSSWNTAAAGGGIVNREELNSTTVTERDAYEYNEDNSADSSSFNSNAIAHQGINSTFSKSNPPPPPPALAVVKESPSVTVVDVKPPLAPIQLPIDRGIIAKGSYTSTASSLHAPVKMTSTTNIMKLKEEIGQHQQQHQYQQQQQSTAASNSFYADNDRNARQRTTSDSSSFTDSISSDTSSSPLRRDKNFNGVCNSAVFPVPVSSLSITVWSAILQPIEGTSDLLINPYGHLMLPFSELLDLTIPPVDAIGYSSWPKPHSYYRQGSLPNGSTHCVAGKHTHNRAPPLPNSNGGSYTGKDQSAYDDHYNHNSTHNSGTHNGNNSNVHGGNPYNTNYNMNHQYTQQQQQHQQQSSINNNNSNNNNTNSNINGNSNTHMNPHHEHQAQQQQQLSYTNADDLQRNRNDTGNNSSARITALRQIFPTVKIGNAINSN